MEKMDTAFLPLLNKFSELLKQGHTQQAKHVVAITNRLKELTKEYEAIKADTLATMETNSVPPPANFMNACENFIENRRIFFEKFQAFIDQANFMLGKFSNHWGGYIEQMGVEYMLNLLRKDYEVHTWYQKFKKYWHKSRNVEIDLLAMNDSTAYFIEVKNQLKPEVIKQILTILDKIREHCPELHHLKIQPIIMCIHADENLIKTLNCGGIWIYKYSGLQGAKSEKSWELLHH